MQKITRADVARLTGLSRAGIKKAVDRGALILGADGLIDADEPTNAAWIARKRAALSAPPVMPPAVEVAAPEPEPKQAPKPKAEKPRVEKPPKEKPAPKHDTVSPPTSLTKQDQKAIGAILEVGNEKLKLTVARRRQAEADTRIKAIRVATLKKELIPRELVRQMLAGLDVALKSNFRDMPRRISAPLHAVMVAEGARAGEAMLEREISNALKRVIDEATKTEGR